MGQCDCCQDVRPLVEVVTRNAVLGTGVERLCRVCADLLAAERSQSLLKSPVTADLLRAGRLDRRLAA